MGVKRIQAHETPMYARSAHTLPAVEAGFTPFLVSVSLDEADVSLLVQFCADAIAAAVSAANLLSAYNAVEFSKGMRLPPELAQFAPLQPASFAMLPQSGVFKLLGPATRAGLKGFSYYHGKSGEELERVLQTQERQGGIVHPQDVAEARDVTNGAACFAKLALKDLLSIETRVRHEFEVAQLNYLAFMLDDVLEGKSPLLVEGHLVPVRDQFEVRQRRVSLNAEALVCEPRRVEQRVLVTNISVGGLGFKGASNFVIGQSVEIVLAELERRFKGRLAWKLGGQAGIEFDLPIAESDPILIPHETAVDQAPIR